MTTTSLGRTHPLVSRLRRLSRSAEAREAERVILLEGIHLAEAALDCGMSMIETLVSPKLRRDAAGSRLLEKIGSAGVEPRLVSDQVMESLHDAASHQGILILASRPRHQPEAMLDSAPARGLILLTCGVQDPGNAGALVRLADACGGSAVVAAEGADPFSQKALRAAAGSTLRLPVARLDGQAALRRWLAQAAGRGFCIGGAVPRGGTPYRSALWSAPMILAVGSEGGGLPDAVERALTLRLTIPVHPRVESLNVATAAAILMFEASHRLGLL